MKVILLSKSWFDIWTWSFVIKMNNHQRTDSLTDSYSFNFQEYTGVHRLECNTHWYIFKRPHQNRTTLIADSRWIIYPTLSDQFILVTNHALDGLKFKEMPNFLSIMLILNDPKTRLNFRLWSSAACVVNLPVQRDSFQIVPTCGVQQLDINHLLP